MHRHRQPRSGPHVTSGQHPRVHSLPEIGDIQTWCPGVHGESAERRDVGSEEPGHREKLPAHRDTQPRVVSLEKVRARFR